MEVARLLQERFPPRASSGRRSGPSRIARAKFSIALPLRERLVAAPGLLLVVVPGVKTAFVELGRRKGSRATSGPSPAVSGSSKPVGQHLQRVARRRGLAAPAQHEEAADPGYFLNPAASPASCQRVLAKRYLASKNLRERRQAVHAERLEAGRSTSTAAGENRSPPVRPDTPPRETSSRSPCRAGRSRKRRRKARTPAAPP